MLKQILSQKNQGFTLLELSIAIVIIGLIVAGVSAGQSLVDAAKKRQVAADLTTYETAINSFELAYGDLPGDLPNAYDYWGSSCDATDTNCNGNGDGVITHSGGPSAHEGFRFWQHLYLSELIETEYTGIGQGTGDEAVPGVNVPQISLRNDLGVVFAIGSMYGAPIAERHRFTIAEQTTNASLRSGVTAPEAYYYDNKFDDGKPLQGYIRGYHYAWGTPYCRNANNVNADYSLTRTTQEDCTFYWTF